MKYTEILNELKERGASKIKPLTPFADWHEDKEDNGFVVLPDGFPVNYLDPIYKAINLQPIWGLTYEGYAWIDAEGNLGKARLDLDPRAVPQFELEQLQALKEIKENYVSPIFGFDNNHIEPIELKGIEGARYLATQLRQLEADLNNPLDKQEQKKGAYYDSFTL